MTRVLGLVLLAGLAWLLIRRVLGSLHGDRDREPTPRFEKTVRCRHCGVYLPVSSARAVGDTWTCSECDGQRDPRRPDAP